MPWMFLGSSAKRTQLQNAADWITRGRVPVRTEGEPRRLERPGMKRAQPVSAVREPGGWRFTLRDLPPWSTVAVVL
jgi:hypothetical protein